MPHIGVRTPYLLPPRPGLGQVVPQQPLPPPAPATVASDPWGVRLAAAFGTPLVHGLSTRIAGGGGRGGGWVAPFPSGGGGFGFGLDPSTLLVGAVLIGAFLIFSKR